MLFLFFSCAVLVFLPPTLLHTPLSFLSPLISPALLMIMLTIAPLLLLLLLRHIDLKQNSKSSWSVIDLPRKNKQGKNKQQQQQMDIMVVVGGLLWSHGCDEGWWSRCVCGVCVGVFVCLGGVVCGGACFGWGMLNAQKYRYVQIYTHAQLLHLLFSHTHTHSMQYIQHTIHTLYNTTPNTQHRS